MRYTAPSQAFFRFDESSFPPSSTVPTRYAGRCASAIAWLKQRSGNVLFPVRTGKAYATWGGGGQCGSDLEVLASGSGKSCGCLKISQLSRSTTVARDGSLIVPQQDTPSCAYDLYPKLLGSYLTFDRGGSREKAPRPSAARRATARAAAGTRWL